MKWCDLADWNWWMGALGLWAYRVYQNSCFFIDIFYWFARENVIGWAVVGHVGNVRGRRRIGIVWLARFRVLSKIKASTRLDFPKKVCRIWFLKVCTDLFANEKNVSWRPWGRNIPAWGVGASWVIRSDDRVCMEGATPVTQVLPCHPR